MAMSEFFYRKLRNSSLCADAVQNWPKNSAERLAPRRAASSCNAFAIATFSSVLFVFSLVLD